MKIWTFSDLHLEVCPLSDPLEPPAGTDVCVMAGDLTNKSPARMIQWLAENIAYPFGIPVVCVAGNHEYYRGSLMDGLNEAREVAKTYPDVHFLENDLVAIDGVRFIGATLWSDFRIMGQQPLAMEMARGAMNDYRAISKQNEPWKRLLPMDTLQYHEASRRFIEDALRIPFDGKTVVVTHYGPHPWSVHDKYRGDLLNGSFVSDLSEVMEFGRPEVWVHAHTHDTHSYVFEETHVYCNPRGYDRENRNFDPALLIDLDDLKCLPEATAP